ncbi:protein C3orf33 [Hetaerina americana]|uniref:protein C3orf33 n=1 Tax=Hetaerina americana TaxID=62018 RepID=UPI003A7F439C
MTSKQTNGYNSPNGSRFQTLVALWEGNTYGVEFGLYSLGLVTLGLALKTVRPFLRFRTPRDIPSSFLEKNMCFSGRVIRVEPTSDSPILIVEHNPIISLTRAEDSKSGLPIKPVGTDIGPNGLAWMHYLLVGKEVSFTLMKASPNFVHCIVTRNTNDVGLNLVSLGFASVSAFDLALAQNKYYKNYYKKLLQAENKAEKRGIGMWMGGGSVLYQYWYKLWSRMNRKKSWAVSWT